MGEEIVRIPLDRLHVSPYNTRKDLEAGQEDASIEDLAESIRQHGLMSPLIVRPCPDGTYEVISGQRRLRACQRIGYNPVPCIVREGVDDAEATVLSLVENVQRADMDPLDKARALQTLYERYGSYKEVARRVSLSESTVRKYIRLLQLPEELQARIGSGPGSVRIEALSRLASSFSGADAIRAYELISGFNERIQLELIRRSEGDLARLAELREEAMEGAFDVRRCGGYRCEIMQDIVSGKMSVDEFEHFVEEVARQLPDERRREAVRAIARQFWKSLARGTAM